NPRELLHVSAGNNYSGIRTGLGLLLGRENAEDVNLFSNSDASSQYLFPAPASRYIQYQGYHGWYTAPGGTAGNPIAFTERMRLSQAGGLSLGSVGTDPGTGNLLVSGNAGIGTTPVN